MRDKRKTVKTQRRDRKCSEYKNLNWFCECDLKNIIREDGCSEGQYWK